MSENKRIAKNSLILYVKLALTTVIGLFTTRLVLRELGADDYGLYAVVGGIVSMMGIISPAISATTYRFIAIEMGKGSQGNVNKVFSTSLMIHVGLALVFALLAETGGLWYVHNYLNVTVERIPDAVFVLHFVVIATVVSIISAPYQGLLTANESFLIKSVIAIIGSLLKLTFLIMLTLYLGNKLRAYAVIMLITMVIPAVMLYFYCYNKQRNIVRFNLNKDWLDYKTMFGFTGWILTGAIAHVGVRQGAAIIINLFFGTVLNAAFGIATQVYNYIMMFVNNLNQAAVPQIMKSHSSGDSARSLSLLYFVSKYAFFVMLLPSVPIILSVDSILGLWLKDVPEFTKQFTVLMVLGGLIGVLGSGFDANIQATGKIRKAQVWYSSIMLSSLPTAYLFFYLGYPPYTITVITIGASFLSLLIKIRILKQLTKFSSVEYINKTIKPVFLVSIIISPQYIMRNAFGHDLLDIIVFSILSSVLTLLTIFFIGLTAGEKVVVKKYINKLRNKSNN